MNKRLIPVAVVLLATPAAAADAHMLKDPPVTIRSGYVSGRLPAPKNCRVEFSRVTLAGRLMGVKSMSTYWCTAPDPRDL